MDQNILFHKALAASSHSFFLLISFLLYAFFQAADQSCTVSSGYHLIKTTVGLTM